MFKWGKRNPAGIIKDSDTTLNKTQHDICLRTELRLRQVNLYVRPLPIAVSDDTTKKNVQNIRHTINTPLARCALYACSAIQNFTQSRPISAYSANSESRVRSWLQALHENASSHSVSDFILFFIFSMRNKWRSVSLSGSDEQKEPNIRRVVDFFLPLPFQPFYHSLLYAFF